MKKTLFLLLVVTALLSSCKAQPSEQSSDIIVLQNVNLLTMESDDIEEGKSLIIRDGVIEWVGDASNAEIPENSKVIEGEYYVMPGLAEMHAHIPSSGQTQEQMEQTLALYLTQGITTVRGMLGAPVHLEMRERAKSPGFFSPRIFTSGPSFNGNSATDPEKTRQMVRDQAEAGYDLLKLHPGITLENFEALADEANSRGIEFSGHISARVGLERTLASGQGTIEHTDRYMEFLAGVSPEDRVDPNIIYFGYDLTPRADRDRIDEAARITEEAGVWVVPTNTLLENVFNPDLEPEEMLNWPGMEYISESVKTGWANYVRNIRQSEDYDAEQAREFLAIRKDLTKALHDEGAGLLLGADAPQIFNPPGYSTHRELALLVEYGLSPYEAVKTGTVNVGVYLGEADKTGKIAPGYHADLILLNKNPLQSIPFHDAIEGVVYRGSYADRRQLDQILESMNP
jgi:imidazolonepropionase-like amidohydrolase